MLPFCSPAAHRIGELRIGAAAQVAATASAHRGAAFEACRELLEAAGEAFAHLSYELQFPQNFEFRPGGSPAAASALAGGFR
ncbi:molybdenum cofactor biosynthesis protein MoaE [Paeniglutamicibacter sp.]|uniref:molybdenum cofactor biosynthesis protein MoaE n=1 Tax=Paeniglutamicibacter sp. TaxID=1934391 RepID=UPI00398A22C8